MTGTNKKYLHLGIIEWWQLDCSLGLEMLPIEVNDYSGAFFRIRTNKVRGQMDYGTF